MSRMQVMIFFAVIFLAAVIAGVTVSLGKEKKKRKPFAELLAESMAVPELTGKDCTDWFLEKNREFPGINVGILKYASADVVDALGYDCPPDVNLSQYLVQMLVREETKECLAYRLINFETIAPNLKGRIENGGMTITF